MMSAPNEIFDIQQLIARFFNSFDTKEWDRLGNCLSDSVHTDYSDLRGTPPETMPRERFVESRQAALGPLLTHHLAGNVEVSLTDGSATGRVSMLIRRRTPQGSFFNTHCLYFLRFEKAAGQWRICSIRQQVLWNEGDRQIHSGTADATFDPSDRPKQ
jgi:scytalone dehydratase